MAFSQPPVTLPLGASFTVMAPMTLVAVITFADNGTGDTVLQRNGVTFLSFAGSGASSSCGYAATGLKIPLLAHDVLKNNSGFVSMQLIFD